MTLVLRKFSSPVVMFHHSVQALCFFYMWGRDTKLNDNSSLDPMITKRYPSTRWKFMLQLHNAAHRLSAGCCENVLVNPNWHTEPTKNPTIRCIYGKPSFNLLLLAWNYIQFDAVLTILNKCYRNLLNTFQCILNKSDK
jgi:hypothetical protein